MEKVRSWASSWWSGDPRRIQLTYQVLFMGIGLFALGFSTTWTQIVATLSAGLLTQAVFLRGLGLQRAGYLSALNASFSVCMLLRSETWWGLPLAAALANASKFVIRVRGKHVFNPSNFGIVATLLLLPSVNFIPPAQWSYEFYLAGLCLMLGSTIVYRVRRFDISWTFFLSYMALIGIRTLVKDQGLMAWLYQFNAGLVIFAFFMISDPKTIPDHRAGRILFAGLLVAVAYLLTNTFYQWNARLWMPEGQALGAGGMAYAYYTNGILFSLFVCSPLVPLIDRLWRAEGYQWSPRSAGTAPTPC